MIAAAAVPAVRPSSRSPPKGPPKAMIHSTRMATAGAMIVARGRVRRGGT